VQKGIAGNDINNDIKTIKENYEKLPERLFYQVNIEKDAQSNSILIDVNVDYDNFIKVYKEKVYRAASKACAKFARDVIAATNNEMTQRKIPVELRKVPASTWSDDKETHFGYEIAEDQEANDKDHDVLEKTFEKYCKEFYIKDNLQKFVITYNIEDIYCYEIYCGKDSQSTTGVGMIRNWY
jgi:hypothetical protein